MGSVYRFKRLDPQLHKRQAASENADTSGGHRGWRAQVTPRRIVLGLLALGGGLAATALILTFIWTRDLPAFDTLRDYRPLLITHVYGVDGKPVFGFYRERRTIVPFVEIPEVMKKAVLASEDARFYQHAGINYLAIARCVVRNTLRGRSACGASTITQQVVRTFLLTSKKEVSRKVKEIVLAKRLEGNLSKDEILYLYLNQIYFGHRRYGIEEASKFYFGKSVRELTLGEAAVLAGVVQSPERLSPVKHPEAAKERQKYVLRRMAEEGFIQQKDVEAEVAKPILVAVHPLDPPGSYYADAVRKYLNERYGADRVETEGLVVEVAMDSAMQQAAEDALREALRVVDKRQGWRGAMQHLDEKQVTAVMSRWRERLKATKAKPSELLVWDLAQLSSDDVEEGDASREVAKMARPRPLLEGAIYAGLVSKVTDKAATIDLGNTTGQISIAELKWARKFNPTSATSPPRRASDVVSRGDIVLVRVLPGKVGALDLARSGKPLALALEQLPLVQGAFVTVDPTTRGVRALVGGYDFNRSQFNRAIQANRQPGSAFKPFVWGAAIDSQRFTPATIVYDTPEVYRDPWTGKEWKPQNFEKDAFDGPLLLKAALAHSKNTVAAKLVEGLGVDAVSDFARRAGIVSEMPRSLSLALGTGEVKPIELVNAYATIAANGMHAESILVVRVKDRNGQVLEEHLDAISVQAIRPEVSFVLGSMMRDVVEYGTGGAARALGRPVAAKTGTAQDHRDAWFVGFTPELVAGVWIGFDSHEPMGARETGGGAALPAWLAFMKVATALMPITDFQPPENVEFARIDPTTGLLARFAEGEAPPPRPVIETKPGAEPVLAPPDPFPFVPFVAGTAPTASSPDGAAPSSAPQNFFQDDQ